MPQIQTGPILIYHPLESYRRSKTHQSAKKIPNFMNIYINKLSFNGHQGKKTRKLRKKQKENRKKFHSRLLASVERLKQAKGFDRANEEPQNLAPANDTQPTPNTAGARLRMAATSIAGIWKRLAAAAHVIFRLY